MIAPICFIFVRGSDVFLLTLTSDFSRSRVDPSPPPSRKQSFREPSAEEYYRIFKKHSKSGSSEGTTDSVKTNEYDNHQTTAAAASVPDEEDLEVRRLLNQENMDKSEKPASQGPQIKEGIADRYFE